MEAVANLSHFWDTNQKTQAAQSKESAAGLSDPDWRETVGDGRGQWAASFGSCEKMVRGLAPGVPESGVPESGVPGHEARRYMLQMATLQLAMQAGVQ
jgi:hypothetical protein